MRIGQGLGSALGNVVMPGAGGSIGGMLGSGLGWAFNKITGMGDYKVKMNTLVKSSPVPQFGPNCIRIKHKEYLGDLSSTTGFTNTAYAVNPGVKLSFPWLANIAANYEEYMFVGLVYMFVSTSAEALNSTNTALGKLLMATEYDAQKVPFGTPQQMLATEFCNYGKPANDLMHAVECDPSLRPILWQYVRTSPVPTNSDPRLYDLGIFQIATQGMQAASNVGGLWVSYDVILCKPVISALGIGYDQYVATNVAPAATAIFSTSANQSSNPVGTTITNNVVSFPPSSSAGVYRLQLVTYLPGIATVEATTLGTLVNCVGTSTYNGFGTTTIRTGNSASSTADWFQEIDVRLTATNATFSVATTTTGTNANYLLRVTYMGL